MDRAKGGRSPVKTSQSVAFSSILRLIFVVMLPLAGLHQASSTPADRPAAFAGRTSAVSSFGVMPSQISDRLQSQGNTLLVPAQYSTIQAAIDAAQTGDTVLIAPGTYNETPVIANKVITLASEFLTTGDASRIDATILQGNGTSHGVTVQATAAGTALVGLTFRSGGAGSVDGVRALGSVQLQYNHIIGYDDGIDFDPILGTVGTCVCQYNVVENGTDDGIDLDGASNAVLEGNTLRNNKEDGIEIRFDDYANPLSIEIRSNRLQGNGQDGIQLIDLPGASNRRFRIERNDIIANGRAGLGLMDNGNSGEDYRAASLLDPIDLINNTFVGNDHAVSGGDNLVAVNNIFVNAKRIGLKNVDGHSIAAYNLFWNIPTNETGSNVDQSTTLVADPLLAADYTLSPGSPAIDAGTARFEWRGQAVVDMAAGTYNGSAPDLGAHESGGTGPVPSPTATHSPTPLPTSTPTTVATSTPSNTPTVTPVPPTPGGTQTAVFVPEADARVEVANPTTNFGTATTLSADQDRAEESYLRFRLTGIGDPIQQAILRLYATGSTVDGPQIYTATDTWTEPTITGPPSLRC